MVLQGNHTLLGFAEALLYFGWKAGYVGPVRSQTWLTGAEASTRVMLNNIGNKIGFIFSLVSSIGLPLVQGFLFFLVPSIDYLWSKENI